MLNEWKWLRSTYKMSFEDLSKQFKFSQATYCRKHSLRKHNFKKHANALVYKKYEKMKMGEYVQIDHMTVTKNGVKMKRFQAWERKSKTLVAQVYSSAKSSNAKKFLQELVAKAPYKIKSIQVDGGSKFMADFEDESSKLNVPSYVLPPANSKI